MISRIESVTASQIDSVGGDRVLQYRGGTIPLLCLHEALECAEATVQRLTQIAVFKIRGREAGLIIPGEVDLRDVEMSVDDRVCRRNGVVGSLVIDGHTTRLIDLVEIAQQAHPEWFANQTNAATDNTSHAVTVNTPDRQYTILLAEDSGFFRRSVSELLSSEGYRVIEAEDGSEAWRMLSGGTDVDLLLTDIEMPNMDGFELSRRVKQHDTMATMPIIALTSLAGREHEERARACGINEYQVKMDRDAIRTSVFALLNAAPHDVALESTDESLVGAGS